MLSLHFQRVLKETYIIISLPITSE